MSNKFKTVKELENYLLEQVGRTITIISNDLMGNDDFSDKNCDYDTTIDLINRAKISCQDRLKIYENRYKYSNGDSSTKEKKIRQIDIEKIKLLALDRYLEEVKEETAVNYW